MVQLVDYACGRVARRAMRTPQIKEAAPSRPWLIAAAITPAIIGPALWTAQVGIDVIGTLIGMNGRFLNPHLRDKGRTTPGILAGCDPRSTN
jgi:hypothetical protein